MTHAKEHKKDVTILHKIFGRLNLTWPKTIAFAVIMGIYTAIMALVVPDGNSFHDIVVTPEWWVLPAILVIVNSKKPLDAALKVFVFFLISQPLVYLIQVPFNQMGWSLFGYYPYWFKITLLTLPAGFIGWFMKKDQWYSGIILASMTVLLTFIGINFTLGFKDSFPNHLFTVIYCFSIIPIFIFGIFRKWQPRIVAAAITVIAAIIIAIATFASAEPFETYRNSYDGTNGDILSFEFGDNPEVTSWSGTGKGNVTIIDVGDGTYTIKLTGKKGGDYYFTITDSTEKDYEFHYYYSKDRNAVILEKAE